VLFEKFMGRCKLCACGHSMMVTRLVRYCCCCTMNGEEN
jgi:hypothetical protein